MVPETIVTVKSQGLLSFHKLCIDMQVNKTKFERKQFPWVLSYDPYKLKKSIHS